MTNALKTQKLRILKGMLRYELNITVNENSKLGEYLVHENHSHPVEILRLW